ncbi:MAG: precorrin-6A/cobalt-precorrin-6A reductase, partial [Pikeienuella sp.]
HRYLLRVVAPPAEALPLPQAEVVVDRGPFTAAGDEALMRAHRIDLVVAKNAGGGGADAKLAAARTLGLPVLMIARPPAPPREEAGSVEEALDWLARHGVDLGV